MGVAAELALPPPPFDDWNEAASERRKGRAEPGVLWGREGPGPETRESDPHDRHHTD
jgi:hypothetical protein